MAQSGDERFCRSCGRPLVQAARDGEPLIEPDELTTRARKILPRVARGEPERVAVVQNLAEGELVQGILLEEGIPSILRRAGGFDVPDMLAAGPRYVMVPASGAATARELLTSEVPDLGAGQDDLDREADPSRVAMRLAAGMLAALLLFGAVAGALYALLF
ncbi:MAG: hypothetical protein H0V25_08345 [Solirubrobacterales bacterium]|nr:hypothetical protein [Solirubrobacterales bacterium]